MKNFNIRLHRTVAEGQRPIKVCCDDRTMGRLAAILEESTAVVAYNVDGEDGPSCFKKYQKELFQDKLDAKILDAVMAAGVQSGRTNNTVTEFLRVFEKEVEEFNYVSKGMQLPRKLYVHLTEQLRGLSDTYMYNFGMEYYLPGKCRLLISKDCTMAIRSNKPVIKIGDYVFKHETKHFYAGGVQ
jgi:hypothetical protein